MTDAFNEELRKAIERYKIENKKRAFELSRRWGKSVSQQAQMDQHILDAFRYSILPSTGSITIAGTPPVTPDVWIREYCAEWARTSETEGEQTVALITTEPSKGVDMAIEQELKDMRLFENSGFFNAEHLRLIAIRTKEQWSSSLADFAHVCFTANGGAYAFVIIRRSGKLIHNRILGCPNDKVNTGPLFRKEHTVTIGSWSITQGDFTSVRANELNIPYYYDELIGKTKWTDGFSEDKASQALAQETFYDCLDCFKQAELEGMIQNLSITGTYPEHGRALSEVKAPIIKLMDLELF